jgi:hypothetical protein
VGRMLLLIFLYSCFDPLMPTIVAESPGATAPAATTATHCDLGDIPATGGMSCLLLQGTIIYMYIYIYKQASYSESPGRDDTLRLIRWVMDASTAHRIKRVIGAVGTGDW